MRNRDIITSLGPFYIKLGKHTLPHEQYKQHTTVFIRSFTARASIDIALCEACKLAAAADA
jgi:hypothetical protein